MAGRINRRTVLEGAVPIGLGVGLAGCTDEEDSSEDDDDERDWVTKEDLRDDADWEEGQFRPSYHFAPERGWMNDPNGMVYHDGRYHLFFQYNPDGTQWANIQWGHATSEDLLSWDEHGVKLPYEDGVHQFSGGAVVDESNTTGFGENALVLSYTGHHDASEIQDQRIAYSTDSGETVTKYAENPVIDSDVGEFRDPNVFWYDPDDIWILAVSRVAPTEGRPAGIEFYSSPDHVEWTYESTYEIRNAHDADIWECPDLYELPVEGGDSRWILSVSVGHGREDHHLGRFDGSTFTLDRRIVADHGFDFYAAMSWANEPQDRRVMLAWLNNWAYAGQIPGPGWRGTQTFPRRIRLVEDGGGVELRQQPVAELESLRESTLVERTDAEIAPDADPIDGEEVQGRCLEVDARIHPADAAEVGVRVRESDDGDQRTTVSYQPTGSLLRFDRSESGAFFDEDTYGERTVTLDTLEDGSIRLRLLVDRSSVELFANDGRLTMSNLVFPDWDSTGVSLFARNGTARLEELTVYELGDSVDEPADLV